MQTLGWIFPRMRMGVFCLLASLAIPLHGSAQGAEIPAGVLRQLQETPDKPVWLVLNDKADLSPAQFLMTKRDKGRFVYETLKSTAQASQAPLRETLDRMGVSYRPYYIVNALLAHVDLPTLQRLAIRDDIRKILPNPDLHLLHQPVAVMAEDEEEPSIEWNVEAVHAPELWEAGYSGQGIVVGGADTGVDWTHPSLQGQYRGMHESSVDHNHNWFDALEGRPEPYDDNNHGTFTLGQMVGDDRNGNQIGVAPGAQWIACKNMNALGIGSPESYIGCFQWFLAPTDTAGDSAQPELAPHIVNNSWGCPSSEGCDEETLHDIINALQSAGIILIFSAGNSGPQCGTVEDPPATYPEVISVGATDMYNFLAPFSSRGPSSYDEGPKPSLSAPGVDVRSSIPGGSYTYMSGTSMASPEVSGVIALLWSANPALIGDIEGTRTLLESSALFKVGPRCGIQPQDQANNTYGHGLLDAEAAFQSMESIELTGFPPPDGHQIRVGRYGKGTRLSE